MADELLERIKKRYLELLKGFAKDKTYGRAMLQEKWVSTKIEKVLFAQKTAKVVGETKLSYTAKRLLKGYDVKVVNKKYHLMKKCKELIKPGRKETYKMVIPMEHSFEIVFKSHIETNHGNSNDMFEWLDENNYTVASLCPPILRETCSAMNPYCSQEKKKKKPPRKITESPPENKYTVENTVSVTFLDMSLQPDNSFRYLLVYEHLESRFIQLRPLTATDLIEETTMELMKIFHDFSPPKTIRAIAATETIFKAVLERLNSVFAEKITLYTFDVIAVNALIEAKLKHWMLTKESQCWSIGCHYVQWEINSAKSGDVCAFVKFFRRPESQSKKSRKLIKEPDATESSNRNASKTKTKNDNSSVRNVNNLAYGLNNAQIFNLETPMGSVPQNQPRDMSMIQQQQAKDLPMAKLQQANNEAQNQQGNYLSMIPNQSNNLLVVQDQAKNLFLLQNQAFNLSVFQNEPNNLSMDQNQQGTNLSIAQNQSNNMTIAKIETDNLPIL